MLNIVTALACEANPIIRHFRLRKSERVLGLPVFRNDNVQLIISGMGTYAAATAVGYVQGLLGDAGESPSVHAWLNVGIAGHRNMPLGTALLAHRVRDTAAAQRFYPCFTFDPPCATTEVITVQQPESAYGEDAAYDMEALGFCAAAARFSSFELIHCLKIVSDNATHSHVHLTKQAGEQLVGNQLSVVANLVDQLTSLQKAAQPMPGLADDYQVLARRFRFTVSQQNQLKRLLQRWRALHSSPVHERFALHEYKEAKDVLEAIETHLQSMSLRL